MVFLQFCEFIAELLTFETKLTVEFMMFNVVQLIRNWVGCSIVFVVGN